MNVDIKDPRKVQVFATVFKHLRGLIDVVNLHFDEEGLHMQGLDFSHACLFELALASDWFAGYKVARGFQIGVCCEILSKIIRCHEDGQTISLRMDEDDKLLIDFTGEKTLCKNFELPLIDIVGDTVSVPDIEHTADMEFVSSELASLIHQLDMFGDDVRLSFRDNGMSFTAFGENGRMVATIPDDLISEYCIEEEAKVDLVFSLSYMRRMCSFSQLSDRVHVHCSPEAPVKLCYPLDSPLEGDTSESENDYGYKNYMRFFLAPKLDS